MKDGQNNLDAKIKTEIIYLNKSNDTIVIAYNLKTKKIKEMV